MNILIINHEFPPLGGGGGVASYDLALEWARNHRVDVLTSSFGDLRPFETVNNIRIHRVSALFRDSRDKATFISMLSFLIAGAWKGFLLARKNRYDVINTHFAVPAGPLGWLIGGIFSIPNVLSLHGGDIYDPSKKMSPHKSFFWRAVVRFILKKADSVVAQSSNTRDNAVKYYSPDREIHVVPLAFHPPAFTPVPRADLGLDPDDFIIITIGRLVKRKAVDVILNALSLLRNMKIKFLVMGEGPERERLEKLAAGLGLADSTLFLGFVNEEDKLRYLSVSNLFALSSMHEGFGIVFMEAMNCGLPIVCTNHGGQTDFLKNGQNALLFEVGDHKACAEAVKRFMEDRELRDLCSANNREKIKDFQAENIALQYLEIFRGLMKRDGKAN